MSCGPKKVRSEPGSVRFGPILNALNTEPDIRFGSAISLNSDPNLGPVQRGSGSTLGSEPDRGITSAINAKVIELEQSMLEIIKVCITLYLYLCPPSLLIIPQRIPSKVTPVWDGWSTRKRRPYTSFRISFIDSPPGNDSLWELKKYLLKFNSPVGRHTGELIGQDLVRTIRKFQLEDKVNSKL